MSEIRTSGQLRKFMLDAMQGLKDGTMEVEKARNLTKMVAQINESIYSEIKVYKVQLEAGMELGKMGDLNLTESTSDSE